MINEEQQKIISQQHKGISHTPVHIERIRQSNIGKKRDKEAINNISDAVKNLWENEEYRNKQIDSHTGLSSPMKGRHYDETVRKHMSEAHIGVRQSEETKAKISAASKGKVISDIQKEQISKALTGTHYYNNGEIEVRARECPIGFVLGRCPKQKDDHNKLI